VGSTTLITDINGNPQEQSDYYPFGGEIPISGSDPNHYKFTGKERDAESCAVGRCLDNFGARYFGSSLGRFQTPDAFYKDSHVGDPQSWNEYAYARNNPLRYVDPNGGKADVSTNCTTDNQNHTTCNVNVSASIAVYSASGANLSQPQLTAAAAQIQSSIQNAWTGSFTTQDGVTYNVTTQISVSVAGSEADAMKSGAQNVIAINDNGVNTTGPNRNNFYVSGTDRGSWDFNDVMNGHFAAHEFTHLLGVDDKGGPNLSNSSSVEGHWWKSAHATTQDFRWAIGGELDRLRAGTIVGRGPVVVPPANPASTTVGAPFVNEPWWK
jgi:RHS repeat-associated protein